MLLVWRDKTNPPWPSQWNIWTLRPTTDQWISESKTFAFKGRYTCPITDRLTVMKFGLLLQQSEQCVWTISSSSTKHSAVGLQMVCTEQIFHYAGITGLYVRCSVEIKGQRVVYFSECFKKNGSNFRKLRNTFCATMILKSSDWLHTQKTDFYIMIIWSFVYPKYGIILTCGDRLTWHGRNTWQHFLCFIPSLCYSFTHGLTRKCSQQGIAMEEHQKWKMNRTKWSKVLN